MKSNLGSYLSLAIAMLLVGTSVVAGKIIATSLPIFLSSFLGLLIASILFAPTIIKALKKGTLTKSDYFYIGLQALLGTALYRIFLFLGLQHVDASYAGILTALQPAMISLLAILFLRERPTGKEWLGVLLAVTGLFITYSAGTASISISSSFLLGSALILIAIFGEACFSVFAKKLNPTIPPKTIAALVTAVSCVLLLPLALYDAIVTGVSDFTASGLILIVYYGVFLTYISFILWFNGLQKVKASVAGIFTALAPISGVFFSVLLLKDKPETLQLLGGTLIVISIILVLNNSEK